MKRDREHDLRVFGISDDLMCVRIRAFGVRNRLHLLIFWRLFELGLTFFMIGMFIDFTEIL